MRDQLFKLGDKVAVKSRPISFIVNGVGLLKEGGIAYTEDIDVASPVWFLERDLEKVVPKKLFYQYVENCDGSLCEFLMDEFGTTVKGSKQDISKLTRIGTGVELAYFDRTISATKKKSYVDDEDD